MSDKVGKAARHDNTLFIYWSHRQFYGRVYRPRNSGAVHTSISVRNGPIVLRVRRVWLLRMLV